jgi:hypothetical protein
MVAGNFQNETPTNVATTNLWFVAKEQLLVLTTIFLWFVAKEQLLVLTTIFLRLL